MSIMGCVAEYAYLRFRNGLDRARSRYRKIVLRVLDAGWRSRKWNQ